MEYFDYTGRSPLYRFIRFRVPMGCHLGGVVTIKSGRFVAMLAAIGVLASVAFRPVELQAAGSAEVTSSHDALDLSRPGYPGQPLRISGWVRSSNGKPIPGATIFIRHADVAGDDGPEYQASLKTGQDGSYRFSTVLPGPYHGVKHIHIIAARDGYRFLNTEILFKGDPYLDSESDANRAIHLERAMVNDKTILFGRFDMTLRPIEND